MTTANPSAPQTCTPTNLLYFDNGDTSPAYKLLYAYDPSQNSGSTCVTTYSPVGGWAVVALGRHAGAPTTAPASPPGIFGTIENGGTHYLTVNGCLAYYYMGAGTCGGRVRGHGGQDRLASLPRRRHAHRARVHLGGAAGLRRRPVAVRLGRLRQHGRGRGETIWHETLLQLADQRGGLPGPLARPARRTYYSMARRTWRCARGAAARAEDSTRPTCGLQGRLAATEPLARFTTTLRRHPGQPRVQLPDHGRLPHEPRVQAGSVATAAPARQGPRRRGRRQAGRRLSEPTHSYACAVSRAAQRAHLYERVARLRERAGHGRAHASTRRSPSPRVSRSTRTPCGFPASATECPRRGTRHARRLR